MKVINNFPWVHYVGDTSKIIPKKVGKWMCFHSDIVYISEICENAVKNNIVSESKYKDTLFNADGVACFYLNCDDIEGHRKIINYFIENNLIQKTKTGRYYNIPFKFDEQTDAGQYREEFQAEIKLSQFIDLDTGEWIYKG